ncbi:concanavalin A-like lectin/glucanase [Leptospira sp. 'Mane']|uniref:concanavalin A-like lectin/glucanase n=1 Tax=Leptospira sp. 'Mane' TaxID=3387407 RepID=UPI00398B55DE
MAFGLDAKEIIRLTEAPLSDWKRIDAVIETKPGKKEIIRAKENTPKNKELFLDFEGEIGSPESKEEVFSNYKSSKSVSVVSSSYIVDEKHSFFGKKSAYFSGKRNQIHVSVSGSTLFGTNPESFSITVPLLVSEQGASSVVLDRTVFIKGKKYGFSLEIEENKPVFYANNLFKTHTGSTLNAEVRSNISIPRKEWHVISIYFDVNEMKFSLYQNGYETASFEGNSSNITGISFPEFDSTDLVIAKSFFGNMDAVHIHKGEPMGNKDYSRFARVNYSDETKLANQNDSWVISPIYTTEHSFTSLVQFEASFEKPKDTQVNVYFRGSNRKFTENGTNIPWIRIDEGNKIPGNLNQFRFHQWKVWLRSDPEGMDSPSFHAFRYKTKEIIPPNIPTGFRISEFSSSEKKICFGWNSNHEREVQNGGGYMIHFGIEPSRMIGTLFVRNTQTEGLKPIDGKTEENDYKNLKFCADESTLLSNIYIPEADTPNLSKSLEDPKFAANRERRGALFQSGISYYFKISAYNHYYDEWEGRDQKSGLSAPISVHFPKEVSQR